MSVEENGFYHYPAYLNLRGRRCVVVGGGEVAGRKVLALLPCGAQVSVISPEVGPAVRRLAARGRVEWLQRPYRPGDIRGAFLSIAATDEPAVNDEVYRESRQVGALCNVVDVPEKCDFIAPAIFQRGRLLAAISTGGASPALAARLRRDLQAAWGPEYGQVVSLLRGLRGEVQARLGSVENRKRFWLAVAQRSDLLELVRSGRREEARRVILGAVDDFVPALPPVARGEP